MSSHYNQEVLLAQFSLYVHTSGLKPDSFHFYFCNNRNKQTLFFLENRIGLRYMDSEGMVMHTQKLKALKLFTMYGSKQHVYI